MSADSEQPSYHPSYDPAAEVVELCRDLIRIDTTNYGDESGPGERKAAEHVATLLDEVGIESELFELESRAYVAWSRSGAGRRAARVRCCCTGIWTSSRRSPEDWQVDPFSGEIRDGYLWGRGAVDMKDFDAMMLSVVRARTRAGAVPERPIVLCFTADEEAGGQARRPGAGRRAHRAPGALHRGHRRGRRLQYDDPGPAALPDRGGREGHGLDEADRARASRVTAR